MKKEFTIEQSAETVWWYKFTEPNAIGETLTIELSKCNNHGGSNALPVLWKKNGYIDRVLETYWCINTYVRDTEGMCYGRYNPQTKRSEDGKRTEINFDWMYEATEENKEKLIDEVFRIFSSQTGETATEVKRNKVIQYAKENNIDLFYTLPEGWIELESATAPIGSTRISNMKFRLKTYKDKNRKEGLLLLV